MPVTKSCLQIVALFAALPFAAHAQTFIFFDVPGAGGGFVQGTFPQTLNDADQIAGFYNDASDVSHGFLRDSDGTIITFDGPGAVQAQIKALSHLR